MEILSAKELSRYLKINEKKIYRLARESKLPHTKIGGKIVFAREIIDGWIAQTTEREKHLYVAGSDDLLLRKIIDACNSRSDEGAVFYAPVGSVNGLALLKSRAAHLSCVHIMDLEQKAYNTTYIDRFLGDRPYAVVHLYMREQGIYLEKNNPRKVETVADIARKGLRFVNRNRGSGTRLLFDFLLREQGIEPGEISGYEVEVPSHLEAGLRVVRCGSDAAFGIRYVAHMLDIAFVPVLKERFDMVIPEDERRSAPVRRLLAFFDQERILALAGDCTGYDITRTGSVVSGHV